MRFARLHPKLQVLVVASRWADPVDVGTFVRDRLMGLRFTLLLDRDGTLAARTGLVTHPQFAVYDARGRALLKAFALDEALDLIRRARLA